MMGPWGSYKRPSPLALDRPVPTPRVAPLTALLLADEFAATKFDVRGSCASWALTKNLSPRSSELPAGVTTFRPELYSHLASLKPLSPEQLAWSLIACDRV